MDGFEVAEAISGYSKAKETAIIFLSAANTELKFITRGYSSGGLDYITKPVDMDILLLKVKTFYRIYEQSRKLIEIQKALLDEIEFRKKAERKKDEFISIASHELKTPLTTIKGFVQLLERMIPENSSEKFVTTLGKVSVYVDRLNNLISELLDTSKIQSGNIEIHKEPFDIDKLIKDTVENLALATPEYKINIISNTKADILGDELQISQVINNLVSNAIKYSPGKDKIDVYCNRVGNFVKVSVKDYGMGISQQDQAKIFDRFFRARDIQKKFPGMGIGLYICHEIIAKHNGTLWVESEIGSGSTFNFTLPIMKR